MVRESAPRAKPSMDPDASGSRNGCRPISIAGVPDAVERTPGHAKLADPPVATELRIGTRKSIVVKCRDDWCFLPKDRGVSVNQVLWMYTTSGLKRLTAARSRVADSAPAAITSSPPRDGDTSCVLREPALAMFSDGSAQARLRPCPDPPEHLSSSHRNPPCPIAAGLCCRRNPKAGYRGS